MAIPVVIIDDEPWAREVVKTLVEWKRLGLECVGEAEDGEEGLELLRSTAAYIAIVDMRMPGMDGTELLEAISDEFPATRIVVMSGHSDFAYLRQALRSRARDYLIKPVDPADLNRTLERCIADLGDAARARPTSVRTSILFQDAASLEEYVGLRRSTFTYLLELDESRVRESLAALGHFLEAGGMWDGEIRGRIVHDYLFMLEEFVVRAGVEPDPDIFRRRDVEAAGPGEAAQALAEVFDAAIALVREARRFKDVLEIDDVTAHIDHYYQEQISLESVARLFLVSKEHLSRRFREVRGQTVNSYITQVRMEHARRLIVDERVEIKETAFLVGYNDLAHFYRVFKKHFGEPPAQVRDAAG